MGIIIFGKEISEINRYGKQIIEVHKHIDNEWRVVWMYIQSCFGRGYWINDKPWSNTDGWINY
jgi:hypothetical protein